MANMGISTGGSGMRTYKYYKDEFGSPTFRFGSGLSYVPFSLAWSDAALPPSVISLIQNSSVSVTTKNLGDREGDQVLLLYWVGGPSANLTAAGPGVPDVLPSQRLVGFKRVRLEAGASVTLSFAVTAEQLSTLRVSQGSGAVFSREFTVAKTELIRKLEW